jgi:prepilin-type N-terminal cleavage/methylation domain-containing protein
LKSGFTLIEMSMVMVIIGLVIGGILTGSDLINAATQRTQIAQIEKYNTAVRGRATSCGGQRSR